MFCLDLYTENNRYSYVLTQEVITLGRSKNTDIYLKQQDYNNYNEWKSISRYAITFVRIESILGTPIGYHIVDGDGKGNKSSNGVILNKNQVLEFELLEPGDIIRISTNTIIYYKTNCNLENKPNDANDEDTVGVSLYNEEEDSN